MPKEAVDVPSLQAFKAKLDALGSLVWWLAILAPLLEMFKARLDGALGSLV